MIEFVTDVLHVDELYPPRERHRPAWLDRLPAEAESLDRFGKPNRTLRTCPGVTDLFDAGYVLPLWTDVAVTRTTDGEDTIGWTAAWAEQESGAFEPSQVGMPPHYTASPYLVKLKAPWLLRTPRGISTLMLPLDYERDERFDVLPGVIDTDRYHQLHVLLRWRGEGSTTLEAGQPLVLLVPFRRERHRLSVVNDADLFARLNGTGLGGIGKFGERAVANAYRKMRRNR